MRTPPPVVEIQAVAPAGCVLTVRPFCRSDEYWDVYFEVNRVITRALSQDPMELRTA